VAFRSQAPSRTGIGTLAGFHRTRAHVAFAVILGMVASGIGMMVLSGAGPAVFGEHGAVLPNFAGYAPRAPRGLGGFLITALLVSHAGAAFYHQFIRGDGLLRRMWYGG